MSRLDKLITELCPDGVDFKKIGSCCDLEKGQTPIQKAEPGEYPLVVTTSARKTCNTYQFDLPGVCVPLVSSRGHGVASLNEVFYQEGKYAVGNILCCLIPKDPSILSAKFLHIYLNYAKDFLLVPQMKGGANVSLSVDAIARVKVPVPPLPVQHEIVRILDSFTNLTKTLTAELTARKTQSDYYSSLLMNFNESVQTVKLESIAEIGTGSSNTNEGSEEGKYPFFVRSQTPLRKNEYEYDETAIITAGDGVGVGKVFHYIEGKYALHQRAYRIHLTSSEVLPRFFFHYFRATFLPYIEKTMYHGSVASIRRPMLNSFPVPVPTIEEQKRAIMILDSFDSLCCTPDTGLPAEISARQKQYEYYRDKLLTFKELK